MIPKEIAEELISQHEKTINYDEGNLTELEENIEKWLKIYAIQYHKEQSNRFKITAVRDDSLIDDEAFGAYLATSVKEGEGIVLLNIESMFDLVAKNDDIIAKDVFVQVLMHEVGHALEEWFDMDFDEDRIEKIIESFKSN